MPLNNAFNNNQRTHRDNWWSRNFFTNWDFYLDCRNTLYSWLTTNNDIKRQKRLIAL